MPSMKTMVNATFVYLCLSKIVSVNFKWYFQLNVLIHNYSVRSRLNIYTLLARKHSRKSFIKFRGIKIWNAFPDVIKSSSSIILFKKMYKQLLISNPSITEYDYDNY